MKLKHVLLECPYDQWNNPEFHKHFIALIGLKLNGYLEEYRYGVLPFDTSDFVATHHLICRDEGGDLTPLICLKLLTLARCKIHDLAFPPIAALKTIPEVGSAQMQVVQSIVARFEKEPHALAYGGGLTILPEARKDRELVGQLWECLIAAWLTFDQEVGIKESIGFSAVRFKMSRSFGRLGYKEIELNGKTLPAVSMPTLMNGHEATIMHRDRVSEEGLKLMEKYRFWCRNSLQFRAPFRAPVPAEKERTVA